jgi:alpha-galactosidase
MNTLNITHGLSLLSSSTNNISIISSVDIASLSITPPKSQFYAATSFTTQGIATLATCNKGGCAPVGKRIRFLSPKGTASLQLSAPTAGSKFVKVYFTNNDIAFASAFSSGTNTRNLTLSVNGNVQRIEVPLSGNSSELFSPGDGWGAVGIYNVTLDGWKQGSNTLLVGNKWGYSGVQSYGADFVGVEVFW